MSFKSSYFVKSIMTSVWVLSLVLIICGNLEFHASTYVEITFDQIIEESFIPLRQVSETLGFEVQWDEQVQGAKVEQGGNTVSYLVENTGINLKLIDGRFFVKMSVFSENHGLTLSSFDNGSFILIDLPTASRENIAKDIEVLSEHAPRTMKSLANQEARFYISQVLNDLGYEVTLQEFEHTGTELQAASRQFNAITEAVIAGENDNVLSEISDEGLKLRSFTNIIASKNGNIQNKRQDAIILLLTTHYDSIAGSYVFEDNGAGAAMLIELARILQVMPANVEVRLIAFDGKEESLFGSYGYLHSLSDKELAQIKGIINLDVFSGKSEVFVHTADGKVNPLSELFVNHKLNSNYKSDHSYFDSYCIPAISLGQTPVRELDDSGTPHYPLADLDLICALVDEIARQAVQILSGSIDVEPKQQVIDSDTVYTIDVATLWAGANDIAAVEEKFALTTIRRPALPTVPGEYLRVQTAMIDWWGLPLETDFEYDGMGIALRFLRLKPGANEAALKEILDEKFDQLEPLELYTFQNFNNTNRELKVAWRGQGREAYLMFGEDETDAYYVSMMYQRSMEYRYEAGVLANSDNHQPRAEELEAWMEIESILSSIDMLDRVRQVTFTDDGIGGRTFNLGHFQSYQFININLDAQDFLLINDENQQKEFRNRLARDLGNVVLTDASQVILEPMYDSEGVLLTNIIRGYYPESYVMQYVDAFGADFPFDASIPIALENQMLSEIQQALIAFITDINVTNLSQDKIDFFNNFPELNSLLNLR